jgi:protein-disulfide isomerase
MQNRFEMHPRNWLAIATVLILGAIAAAQTPGTPAVSPPAPEAEAIVRVRFGDLADAPSIGHRDAPVTVVAFIDYQCPYCARAHEILERVLEKYPEKVRIVFKHNPLAFHPDAELAAQAVLAAQDLGKFPEMHRKLLANQKELDRDKLVAYAGEVGLAPEEFQTALDSGTFADKVKADVALAEKIGVNATPYFFVNGREVRGAKPLDAFAKVIDEELAGPAAPTRWVDRVEPPTSKTKQTQVEPEDLLPAGSADAMILRHISEVHKELRSLRAEVKQLRSAMAQMARQQGGQGEAAFRASGVVPTVSLDDDPVRGRRDAKIGIVAFSDYQCAYSRKAAINVLPLIQKAYVDTGKVQYIVRDYPHDYHTQAKGAAVAANCAGKQGRYWEMHDALFQREGALSPSVFEDIASALKLDLAAFRNCLKDPAELEEIQKDMNDAESTGLGVRVTPTFYIGRVEGNQLVNAYKLSGVKTYEDFSRILEALLK